MLMQTQSFLNLNVFTAQYEMYSGRRDGEDEILLDRKPPTYWKYYNHLSVFPLQDANCRVEWYNDTAIMDMTVYPQFLCVCV